MVGPALIKEIPNQVVNSKAAYGPFDLKDYIQTPDRSVLRFSAELVGGASLPKGLICTEDGLLTGIPAKGTEGNYEVLITAQHEADTLETTFFLNIKPSLASSEENYFDKLKSQVWQALEQKQPIPDLGSMLDRPITALDIYYLLERWGVITIWDAFNLDAPGAKKLLQLKGVSKHYNVYDRGSCLVATPKDLFSHDRTLEDGLQTARAMAQEVFERRWTIEMTGFHKLLRAAWVEIQTLSDLHGRKIDVINYSPDKQDMRLYQDQVLNEVSKPELE